MEIEYVLSQSNWLLCLLCPWPLFSHGSTDGTPPAKPTGELKTIIFNEGKKTWNSRGKMCLKRHFSHFFCSGFWQVQLLPNPSHKEARDTLYITVVGDMSFHHSSCIISHQWADLWAVRCWQGWCHFLHAHMPAQCQPKFTWPNQARSAWPYQQQNCQATVKQIKTLNVMAVSAACVCPAELVRMCGKIGI